MNRRQQARYRAIAKQLGRMRAAGYTEETHPDFEPLQAELATLGELLTKKPWGSEVSRVAKESGAGGPWKR